MFYLMVAFLIVAIVHILIHELGHFLVLKFIYKAESPGIVIGNILNKELFKVRIGKSEYIRFYNPFPIKLKGSAGFVYPWNIVYDSTSLKKVWFYSSGYFLEWFVSIVLLIVLLNFNIGNFYLFIVMFLSMFFLGISPFVNSMLGFIRRTTTIESEARNLIKVNYGYQDGRGVLTNSKSMFYATLICSSVYFVYLLLLMWKFLYSFI